MLLTMKNNQLEISCCGMKTFITSTTVALIAFIVGVILPIYATHIVLDGMSAVGKEGRALLTITQDSI
jgi:hypothetical protein